MELIDVTLVPEDDPKVQAVMVADNQPGSSETQDREIQKFMCSFCKKDFNSEEEYDIHVETEHHGILIDDKEALKMTSELTAALNLINADNSDILKTQKIGEEKEEKPIIFLKPEDPKEEKAHVENDPEKEESVKKKLKPEDRYFECSKCEPPLFIYSRDEFESHKETNHDGEDSRGYRTWRVTKSNKMKSSEEDNKYQIKCNLCQQMLKNKFDLNVHMKIHKIQIQNKPDTEEESKDYKCEICPRSFDSDQGRKIHTSRMHNNNEYQCDVCDFISTSESIMKKHKQKHMKTLKRSFSKMKQAPQYYTCKFCGHKSKSIAAMTVHTQIVHNNPEQDSNTESSPPQKKLKAKESTEDPNQTIIVDEPDKSDENIEEPMINSKIEAAPPQERKQILGEKLFPKIQDMCPEVAGKVTEMLLTLESNEVLDLMKDESLLRDKVEEILDILGKNKNIETPKTKEETIADLKKQLQSRDKEITKLKEDIERKNKGLQRNESWIVENKRRAADLIKENDELKTKLSIVEKAAQISERRVYELERKCTEEETDKEMDTTNIEDIVTNKKLGHSRSTPQSQPEIIKPNSKKPTFPCEVCPKEFQQKNHLISHMKNHESAAGSHACPSCQEVCSSKADLTNHLMKHTDGDWPCHKCPLQFNTREAREKHTNIAHNSNPNNECKFCGMNFVTRNTLNQHTMGNHSSFRPCSKFAINKCEFDNDCRFNHVILHEGQYICFKCGTIFSNKTAMIKHVIEKHGGIPCENFLKNQCRFPSSQCFFSHNVNQPTTQSSIHQTAALAARQSDSPGRQPDLPGPQPQLPGRHADPPAHQIGLPGRQPDLPDPQPNIPDNQTNLPDPQPKLPGRQNTWQGFQIVPPSLQPPDQLNAVLQMVQGLAMQLHTQSVHMTRMQQQIVQIVKK